MVDIIDRFPELLPREKESYFYRYVRAHEEETEDYEDDIQSIKLSRQVEQASGDDLDRIGRLFGPAGRRLNREDDEYRRYLKSVVQAFSGRGTDLSMRRAFAAALNIDVDDVEIVEDTDNVEYEIVFYDWTDHSVNSIYEIAQIVDPSGVEQDDLRYNVPQDESQSADDVATTDGLQVVEDTDASVDDILVNITLQETFDDLATADTIDAKDNDRSTIDESPSADAIAEDITVVVHSMSQWDQMSWDDNEWDEKYPYEGTDIQELVEETVETDAGIDTSASAVISEEDVEQVITEVSQHFDETAQEVIDTTDDTTEVNELVEEEVSDDGTLDSSSGEDTITTETSTVLWDDGDWDSMRFGHA